MKNIILPWVVAVMSLALLGGGAACRKKSKPAPPPPPPAESDTSAPSVTGNTQSQILCDAALNTLCFLSPATVPGPDTQALDGSIGFAAGEHNTLLRTADGGQTWSRVIPRENEGPEYTRILFTSPAQGWALSRDRLLHSTDTGMTWSAVAPPGGTFYYFGDIAVSPGRLYMIQPPTCGARVYTRLETDDDWSHLPQYTPRNDGATLSFVDERQGWLAGNYGVLMRTRDGGQSWEKLEFPKNANLAELYFASSEKGWIRPLRGHEGGLWKTDDGGLTWSCASLDIPSYWTLVDMQFFDAQSGVVLVDRGADGSRILQTRDGGKSWSLRADLPPDIRALCFADPDRGAAVGAAGQFHRLTAP